MNDLKTYQNVLIVSVPKLLKRINCLVLVTTLTFPVIEIHYPENKQTVGLASNYIFSTQEEQKERFKVV